MINGKIQDTIFALTNNGLAMQFSISYRDCGENKTIISKPISINQLSDIVTILRVVGEPAYEQIKGAAIQFEITGEDISKIANFCDETLEVSFIVPDNEEEIKDIDVQEEVKND